MLALVQEKKHALELRRKGLSYRDILAVLPVSKSSLSIWLKDLPLTEEERTTLRKRMDSNISRGRIKVAATNRRNRLIRERQQFDAAKKEFAQFKDDSLFCSGVALYWAEGSKRDTSFHFTNSDAEMTRFMVKWCFRYLGISMTQIRCQLYLHKLYAHENCEKFWSEIADIPLTNFRKTVYKPSSTGFKKRPNYKGCLRFSLSGTRYLLKMKFWQKLLIAYSNEIMR
ncbi:MAG: hypothetical protein Q7R88_00045 [bacterium]|nr:hypothetical protein [bacterium]